MLQVCGGVEFGLVFQVVAKDARCCGVEETFSFACNYGGVFELSLFDGLVVSIFDGPVGTIQMGRSASIAATVPYALLVLASKLQPLKPFSSLLYSLNEWQFLISSFHKNSLGVVK